MAKTIKESRFLKENPFLKKEYVRFNRLRDQITDRERKMNLIQGVRVACLANLFIELTTNRDLQIFLQKKMSNSGNNISNFLASMLIWGPSIDYDSFGRDTIVLEYLNMKSDDKNLNFVMESIIKLNEYIKDYASFTCKPYHEGEYAMVIVDGNLL